MKLIRKLRHKAFTLIELVMTIIVVGIIAIPLSITLVKHVEAMFRSQDETKAVNVGRWDMEIMRNTAYANIITASFPNYRATGYAIIRTVSFVQGNSSSAESLKSVKVDVTRTGSPEILASFTTYIARNVSFGQ